MSETTVNQDELATQEMIAMQEEASQTETHENEDSNTEELDSLLETIDEGEEENIEVSTETADISEMEMSSPAATEETRPETTPEPQAEAPQNPIENVDPEQAVSELESALTLQKETELLAEKVKTSSQKAIELALQATKTAQERTVKLQEEINKTYQAAERARTLLEQSGIEVAQIPSYSKEQLPSILQEIHARNEKLKAQNESIKSALSE